MKRVRMSRLHFEEINPHVYLVLHIRKVLYEGRSRFQTIRVIDSASYGRVLILDNAIQTCELDEFLYHELIVHPAMCICPASKDVLIIGGGDGGAAEEALKHETVRSLVMVEIDDEVVAVSERFLPSIHQGAFRDPRITLEFCDGREYIERTDRRFDVVILDLTDPIGPSTCLYTREFYEKVRGKLRPKGILSMHCDAPFNYPIVFGRIHATIRSVFPSVSLFFHYVQSYGLELAFAVCSADRDLNRIRLGNLEGRFHRRALKDLRFYHPGIHKGYSVIPKYAQDMMDEDLPISTDASPLDFSDHYYWGDGKIKIVAG